MLYTYLDRKMAVDFEYTARNGIRFMLARY